MKLHELKKGDRFQLAELDDATVFVFDHLDGMYSYTTTEQLGDVAHFRLDTPVIKLAPAEAGKQQK